MEDFNKQNSPLIEEKEAFKRVLEKLVEEAYKEDPNKSYWEYECLKFSDIMYDKLTKIGISRKEIVRLQADVQHLIPHSKPHYFLMVKNMIIDGTWQQYLDKPRKDHQYLILDTETLIKDLKAANVPN